MQTSNSAADALQRLRLQSAVKIVVIWCFRRPCLVFINNRSSITRKKHKTTAAAQYEVFYFPPYVVINRYREYIKDKKTWHEDDGQSHKEKKIMNMIPLESHLNAFALSSFLTGGYICY